MLVSIVIPTYNRSDLIGATLDSIIAQTYLQWECIVVDDDSIDYTVELMEFYCKKDPRVKYLQRPENRRKGANACRNYGFEKSRGNYIQWFDSDDLMVPEFLEAKVKSIEEHEVDFVISKSANFQDPNSENIISRNDGYYRFDKFNLTNYNYVTQNINWLTYDFLGKRELCEKVRFNETLSSSQEYNFFCKLTCFSTKAFIIDKFLTNRRVHSDSIRVRYKSNPKKEEERNHIDLETWREIAEIKPGSKSERYFLFSLLKFDQRSLPTKGNQKYIFKSMYKQNRLTTVFLFLLYRHFFQITGRGYFLRRLALIDFTN
ncbi:hypothetical protein GCM10007103_32700 [Salinimicrobium marinum]|uniref:Glycosyltransferase 2-like domain-containing protein n=1 Tax=Salinimicrobium marinum TaxID=680283 RepID=A0A918SL66_9FLAO|nr:glycosyltransferase family 2 protein [Salinimicrobium marinum]GHA49346.1 hypothetical protein GCM10007103_32700 [Salinimicrobium marinum]